MDGEGTPQNLLVEVREQNTRLKQLIAVTIGIVARSRGLLSRLGGREKPSKLSTDPLAAFGTHLKSKPLYVRLGAPALSPHPPALSHPV